MITQFDLDDDVRVIRNVRNDGTYPGADMGDLLVRRGSVGTVIDVGTFLIDQIIYTVHFLDVDRIVGCREEELIGADEPWVPSTFESRERVAAAKVLALGDDCKVPRGSIGEVLRVVRNGTEISDVIYHIHFDCLPGRTLAVPESALASLSEAHYV
ncbi:nitrogen fixation protein NifZ [Propionivibrio limicola]|uniref:nitrogen fixation protein NifZ n=1 Tax=Propionivibrio limicola TaxID=167645 RepID=UPI00129272B9|nr:nitrogen fixation protein NifZ [Propionivibrio limicola]